MIEVGALRTRLLIGVAVVAAFGLAAELARLGELVPLFSLSYEANVPTWFSSSLLLVCAISAGAIARAGSAWRLHWWGITGILGWMSLDEAAEFHEHLGGQVGTNGIFYFDWVFPAAAIIVVLGLVYLPFLRALAEPVRRRLVIAAAIYVGGALFMELPLGWWTEQHGTDGLGYALIDWVEETMEMVGASLALVALVDYRRELA